MNLSPQLRNSNNEFYEMLKTTSILSNEGVRTFYTKEQIPITVKFKFSITITNPFHVISVFQKNNSNITSSNDFFKFILDIIQIYFKPIILSQSILNISEKIERSRVQAIDHLQADLNNYNLGFKDLTITTTTKNNSISMTTSSIPNWILFPLIILVLSSVIYILLIT